MSRDTIAKILWCVTALWLVVFLLSLRVNWLGHFFFDSTQPTTQGIDFFPVERAFLNVTAGRSQFDTFALNYGPRATWYVYHPALALVIGPFLAAFSPWKAYALWSIASLALFATAAWFVMRRSDDPIRRALAALLMVGGFPVYITLWVGNVQAILVLSITLVLVALDAMREEGATSRNRNILLAGLLLSLFSKPAVFAFLPLLLMLHQTRRTTLKALGIYAVVSFIFLTVPALNPVAMSWSQRTQLATHPELIKQTMNIFDNGYKVTQPMMDNSVHWFAMIGLSGFRLQHIDVFSLPTFLDGWLGTHTPDALYSLPAILILEMSLLVWFVRSRPLRLEAALLVTMAASLLVFLSYGLVWEYHYTGIFPVAALLLMRKRPTPSDWSIIALSVLVWLPSPFLFFNAQNATLLTNMTTIRLTRVVPVLLIFCLLLIKAFRTAVQGGLQVQPVLSEG